MLLLLILLMLFNFQTDDLPTVWTKHEEPIFTGQFGVASDPAILRDGDLYRMVYTCIDFFAEPRAMICEAISEDGFSWENIDTGNRMEGLVVRGREGEWDENLEAAYLIKTEDEYLLYYSGYLAEGDPMGYPAALALARSDDGVHFERVNEGLPVIEPTKGGYDSDAVYSPVIFEYEGGYGMIYAGHCYFDCDYGWGVRLLGAISPDGYTWTKLDEPVLEPMPDIDWLAEGVAEPALVEAPGGGYWLFFTGLKAEERVLGIAYGETPFGPWAIHPDPILIPTPESFDQVGVLAPHVIIEDDRVRMWYLGVGGEGLWVTGYAEAELARP